MKKQLTIGLAIITSTLIISCSEKKKEEPVQVQEKEVVVPEPEPTGPKSLDLAGAVSKYRVVMHLEIDGKHVDGQYYYKSSGPSNPLSLSGTADKDGNLDIHETNDEGQPTGHFMGQWDGGEFTGEFVNFKGQHFPFKLVKNEEGADIPTFATGSVSIGSDDYDSDSDEDNDSYSYESSSGSEDWDALLNSYEQYVDKYISYAKKAANGDMSALEEYPSLLEKAQEFSEKMENAQGDMSASQWARYIKITNKMATAASHMR
jgi:hypothetical protein